MTKREAQEYTWMMDRLRELGISREDAEALRLISMTLRRWFERECGNGNGCIERNEETNRPYWRTSGGGAYPVADRETGARKRLAAIMSRYPTLTAYVQGDPRGCALYILTVEQLGSGNSREIDAIYTRGLAVG